MRSINLEQKKVLVAGDLMLDRYWHGNCKRISPEAPVPIVNVADSHHQAGGAGNVASNIASLGAQVNLLGLIGIDEAGQILQDNLASNGISCYLQQEQNITTITKLRILSQNQQLLRVDFEKSFAELNKSILHNHYEKLVQNSDLVVLSDYDKGTLSDCAYYIETARSHGKKVIVDPKGSDFSKYRGATLLTPNLAEFEGIAGQVKDQEDLVEKALGLIDSLELEALLITRGSDGMSLIRYNHAPFHLKAKAREVFDVTGAGDTVVATLASAIVAGESLEQAVILANAAAGIVVGMIGTQVITHEMLNTVVLSLDLEPSCV